MTDPAPELIAVLEAEPSGRALDIACGKGRHALWLAQRGWQVTAVDIGPVALEHVTVHRIDLEAQSYPIQPAAWDLIVSWLYYQPSLFPAIKTGLRSGGIVALAGKTTGSFATSLAEYRAVFAGFTELASGENENRVFYIARYNK